MGALDKISIPDEITIEEFSQGRSHVVNSDGTSESAEITYIVRGIPHDLGSITYGGVTIAVPAELMAVEAVRRFTPLKYMNLNRSQIAIDERLSESDITVAVTYHAVSSSTSSDEDGDEYEDNDTDEDSSSSDYASSISFSVSETTEHITTSYATVAQYGQQDQKKRNSINMDMNGHVDGVDRVASTISFTERHIFTRRKANSAYLRRLIRLRNCINNSAFRGFAAGEVMFAGFDSDITDDSVEITFRFLVQPNESARSYQGIQVGAKNGWDYIWPYYEASAITDGASQTDIVPMVRGFQVDRIYRYADFKALGLPMGSF